ncbi:hypothetical protein JBL43_05575 [Aureibaculum sp. A20]|uniref:Outer membrane protein beta-barrel domain-containing protein n=1 Tax=Aureibaculum flavum TaxID=2795986 RepID=A0ABS0WP13_9FLAO|nr:hypothetical protein [Aureibaculum flavum]MBJ2173697.1 hypothetical protein [Aureibaculum flavum]
MKKLVVIAAVALFSFNVNAQDKDLSNSLSQTSQGKWLVQVGTSTSGVSANSLIRASNTGFSFISIDGDNFWNVGLEGGYFVVDNLAVKAGVGYGDASYYDKGIFSYKVGPKYYIIGKIPVGIDLNGASTEDFSPMYVGAQAGYAWFLGERLSVEPSLRYDYGMNEDAGDGDYNPLSLNIGFAFHF